jgi:hypothetical protein
MDWCIRFNGPPNGPYVEGVGDNEPVIEISLDAPENGVFLTGDDVKQMAYAMEMARRTEGLHRELAEREALKGMKR